MTKKILPILSILILAISILLISLSRMVSSVRPSLAAATLEFTVSPGVESTPTPKVDYYLPYPGILPDHPLYKVKMVRDWIWLWLTTEPVKKAELLLLFADKRIGAGKALIEGNQVSLGISTLTKGEKYAERVVIEARNAKEKGKDIKKVVDRLKKALLKYGEVLSDLREKDISSEGRASLDGLLEKIKNLAVEVEELQK